MKIKFSKAFDNIIFIVSIIIILLLLYSNNDSYYNNKMLKDQNLILEDKIEFLNYENKLNEEMIGRNINFNKFYKINERHNIKQYKNSYKCKASDGNGIS